MLTKRLYVNIPRQGHLNLSVLCPEPSGFKGTLFFFFILYNFSSFGLSVLVSSVRQCTGNKFSFSTYAHRAIVVTVRASLISSPQMTVVSYL